MSLQEVVIVEQVIVRIGQARILLEQIANGDPFEAVCENTRAKIAEARPLSSARSAAGLAWARYSESATVLRASRRSAVIYTHRMREAEEQKARSTPCGERGGETVDKSMVSA